MPTTNLLLRSAFVGPFPPECTADFPKRGIRQAGFAKYEIFEFEDNITIDNFTYLQSWRYFENVKDEVRERLRFKKPIQRQARSYLNANTKGASFRVGIHV